MSAAQRCWDHIGMRWRILTMLSAFGLICAFLIFNIYDLQIRKNGYYLTLKKVRDGSLEASAPRGSIYFTDKNGNFFPATLNKEYPTIFAVPAEIQKDAASPVGPPVGSLTAEVGPAPEALAGRRGLNGQNYVKELVKELSSILSIPLKELEIKLSKKNDQYELLVQKAADEEARRVKDLNIKGVYIKQELLRYYPSGNLAAHLLGFVSPLTDVEKGSGSNAPRGRYGVELYFNGELKGGDVALTIDPEIQSRAEEILRKLIEEHQASGGTVIAAEPATGRILAMASSPDFDPNDYPRFSIERFLNPAVQAVYEPGSIFKVITMAAGIDAGKITPDTKYYDAGSVTLNGRTISNWDLKEKGPHGSQTMTGVMENSINTGAVFAEQKTGHQTFYDYLIKFGINSLTGITLPGEVKGSLNNLKNGREIDFATASYGQGVSVTPIELITAVSAIANGGVLMKPYILKDQAPEIIRLVIREETSKAVTQMMISAVEKNVIAAIPNYKIAGKTGTAFIPDFGKKGYTDQVINSYIGFAPASRPKFIVLIKLDKPAGSPLAGQTVVPAFRELAQFIINYYNIPPDKLTNNLQPTTNN